MKFILSENQVRNLVNKLVINEQNGVRTESLTIPMGSIWPMGYWKLTPQQTNQLVPKLEQITNFINKNKGSIITIQIEAGESQVTNIDNEDSSKPKLQPGVLSQRRGQEMVKFLYQYFDGLLKKNAIDKMPEIPQPKQIIGTTEYKKGVTNLKDPNVIAAYQKEQFVNAVITTRKDYECLVGMEITIGYFTDKSKKGHRCDEAIFELRMNGVSIGEANLNNFVMDTILDDYHERLKSNYLEEKEVAEGSYDEFVANGKIKNPSERNKQKFVEKWCRDRNVADPGNPPEIPEWATKKYYQFGYKTPEEFIEAIKTINNGFSKYGRYSDNKIGGTRSQTFRLTGELAKSIIDRAPSDEIVLSIKPLVGPNSKYKQFYYQGSHSDTPWVTIKSRNFQDKALYDGEPNINMVRGSEKETILLRTDLCGKQPINANQTK
jgi:hypothetical protein